MRSAVRLSIHASEKAFTAPKLNLIAIEKLLGPCKGFRVISAFESPVPEEMPVRPDSVDSILFHPEAPSLWLADSAHSARLGIAPPSVYGTKRPAFNSMICRIPRGKTTHGKTPRRRQCPALGVIRARAHRQPCRQRGIWHDARPLNGQGSIAGRHFTRLEA